MGETAGTSEACRLADSEAAEVCRLFDAVLLPILHCRESWREVCVLLCPTGLAGDGSELGLSVSSLPGNAGAPAPRRMLTAADSGARAFFSGYSL